MALIEVHGKFAAMRTVCLAARRRLGKKRGRPAVQAAKQLDDRLLLVSKAGPRFRRTSRL
jgi:hypothetical protein